MGCYISFYCSHLGNDCLLRQVQNIVSDNHQLCGANTVSVLELISEIFRNVGFFQLIMKTKKEGNYIIVRVYAKSPLIVILLIKKVPQNLTALLF